ncbi:MAG: hypothetical protein V4772_07790 [Pseudomonadota bacterium]
MPFTFNGTGTKYYGEREHDIGGTYITTKWVVIFAIPVFPLSSWRVYPIDEERFADFTQILGREASQTSQSFHEVPAPLNWRQILNVYAVTLPLIGLAVWALHRAFPKLFG